jgi:sugar phosphate isomerase/epimerase
MKLGFLTACLPGLSLEAITRWAAQAGFDALELAAWPPTAERDHTAAHLDVRDFGERQAAAVRETLAEHAVTVSALAFYENNLHPDEEHRARTQEHLRACIDAAALLRHPLCRHVRGPRHDPFDARQP